MEKDKSPFEGEFSIIDPQTRDVVFLSDNASKAYGADKTGKKCYCVFSKVNHEACSFCSLNYLNDVTKYFTWRSYQEPRKEGCIVYSELFKALDKEYLLECLGDPLKKPIDLNAIPGDFSYMEKDSISQIVTLLSTDSHFSNRRSMKMLVEICKDNFDADLAFASFNSENDNSVFTSESTSQKLNPEEIAGLSDFALKVHDSMKGITKQNALITPDILKLSIPKLDKTSKKMSFFKNLETYLVILPFPESSGIIGSLFICAPKIKPQQNRFLELIRNIISFSYLQVLTLSQQGASPLFDSLSKVKNSYAYSQVKASFTDNPPHSLGIIFADINGLKYTNDHFGHAAGDVLIQEAAAVLAKYVGVQNVYRIGGDEFVGVLKDITEEAFGFVYNAIRRAFSYSETTSASVGSAFSSGEDISFTQLVSDADKNMYQAKEVYYEIVRLHPEVNDRAYIKTFRQEVAKALVEKKIDFRFVPRYREPEHYVVAADVAITLTQPVLGISDEKTFIEEIESLGAGEMVRLNIFKQVCLFQAKMLKKYGVTVPILVNFGVETIIYSSLGYHLVEIADFCKVPHKYLGIQFIHVRHNSEKEMAQLNELLQHQGFLTSLNHFGSGEANMEMAGSIHFTQLTLSTSYVQSFGDKKGKMIMVGIREIVHSLGSDIVIDNIRDINSYLAARDLGFVYFRGDYLAHPLSEDEFEKRYYKGSNPGDVYGLKDKNLLG